MSSARERRRRQKQEVGGVGKGRVVLRSRSSSDLRKKSIDCSSGKSSGESGSSGGSSPMVGGGRRESEGDEETDGPGRLINGCNDGASSTAGPEVLINDCGKAVDEPDEPTNGINEGASSEESNNEVDEFYTLLDTTLQLPESSNSQGACDEVPEARVAFVREEEKVVSSGRLADRIAILRRLRFLDVQLTIL